MSSIVPINTQQVLHMGHIVEKVQDVAQHLPAVTHQQLEEERIEEDERRRKEVQELDESSSITPFDADSSNQQTPEQKDDEEEKEELALTEEASVDQPKTSEEDGHKIDLVV
ncbi:MAG: hypothetical protein G3M78_11660 [Candidatus Nitrohelix vancouverensis]|uniref:Uncharacterized protein n=1 Tax=Candidatus Nitrohelix vancouverensis TaxID=2705534 RepID=A0A7T0C3U4_9BACT|nr:MAG: hypothetical protein G3M78_11660 [Candidatus Nitrohelix vancouverensis]